MYTLNEQVNKVAIGLGCTENQAEEVLEEMQGYALPLTAKSLVYQVSGAMKTLGLSPNTASIEAIASRL